MAVFDLTPEHRAGGPAAGGPPAHPRTEPEVDRVDDLPDGCAGGHHPDALADEVRRQVASPGLAGAGSAVDPLLGGGGEHRLQRHLQRRERRGGLGAGHDAARGEHRVSEYIDSVERLNGLGE